MTEPDQRDRELMRAALGEALTSLNEGGLPIGAVMVERGQIIASGHNRRVQNNDPTAHGEIDCIRNGGRRPRYAGVTLYTTLSPCMMCSGAIIQFGISSVVIGESRNFPGNVAFLLAHGVDVRVLQDDECIETMARFIREKPELWDEDIAGVTRI